MGKRDLCECRNSCLAELQLTHVDQAAGVVQRAQMRTREREEGVQTWQQRTHLWTSQSAAHDDRAQGMRHKGDACWIQATAVDMVEDLGHQPARKRDRVRNLGNSGSSPCTHRSVMVSKSEKVSP